MEDKYFSVQIVRVKDDDGERMEDWVAREEPITIFLNSDELVTLMCTPEKLDYMALGFLRSEGFVENKSEVKSLQVDAEKGLVYVETYGDTSPLAEKLYGSRTITTGCGKGTTFFNAWDSLRSKPLDVGDFQVRVSYLLQMINSLQKQAVIFKETGGVHSAALCDTEGIAYFAEDVGRHNALDKIVGQCLWEEMEINDKILVSSGRISSEIMLKAAKLQVPVVVSRAAPTSKGVALAEEMSITMVGFARGRRLNIYTCPERIIIDNA